ncbi:unnamed protein product [Urochloa humidicola]
MAPCTAGSMFDETPRKKPKMCPGEPSGGGASMALADRLSALPDKVLHHIMSFLRAWEVARTCVLSRRWRHLWAFAPCVDLRVRPLDRHRAPPDRFAKFVYRFLLERDASAHVDTLRLLSSPGCREPYWRRSSPACDDDDDREDYSSADVDMWIHAAIKLRARVMQLSGHPKDEGYTEFRRVNIVSCHLKVLMLWEYLLSDRTLRQLSSQCPSLEVLDLKECYLSGREISSASLRSLTIVKCHVTGELTIAAPNLLSLRCVKPYHRAPLFQNVGSIATATIVLDDSFLLHGTANDEGSDSDSSREEYPRYCSDSCSDASTCEYSEVPTHNEDEDEQCDDHGQGQVHCKHCKCNDSPYWIKCGYGRRNRFGVDKILGGDNVLHSLSNATSLELLADAGEVILNRELKTCPIFSNLKTLSLGEWCMAADFDPLISFLRHSPNLERLFLELKLYDDDDSREEIEDSTRLVGRSFSCAHLKMLKIKCSEHETRVRLLAELFRANGVSVDKIYVRKQSTCHYI